MRAGIVVFGTVVAATVLSSCGWPLYKLGDASGKELRPEGSLAGS